jgi:hypothetical protein
MFDRIRNFFRSEPAPDHPLTGEERREEAAPTTADESASLIDEFVGPVDPEKPS